MYLTQEQAMDWAADEMPDAFNMEAEDVAVSKMTVTRFFGDDDGVTLQFDYPMPDGSTGKLMAMMSDSGLEWG